MTCPLRLQRIGIEIRKRIMNNENTNETIEYPTVDELSIADRTKILNLSDEDLTKLDVEDYWYDDHAPCVGVNVGGVRFSIWWLSNESWGAFFYPDSAKARRFIREIIKEAVETYCGSDPVLTD